MKRIYRRLLKALHVRTGRYCFRCGHEVEWEDEVPGYPYYCPQCDENMYRFETYTAREAETYANPIAEAIEKRREEAE